MVHEKISPPLPANGAQKDDTNTAGDGGAPSNGDDLQELNHNGANGERNAKDEDEDEDEDEDDHGSEDSSDASNQYWIFVDRQLAKFRAKARKLAVATPDQPAAEVLHW